MRDEKLPGPVCRELFFGENGPKEGELIAWLSKFGLLRRELIHVKEMREFLKENPDKTIHDYDNALEWISKSERIMKKWWDTPDGLRRKVETCIAYWFWKNRKEERGYFGVEIP